MASENQKYLIVVAGPTAIGKTALAIKLAQHFTTEIISADSRQFYKELNIGVAKPSTDELAAAPHHCIGHIGIQQPYTAADFEREALQLLRSLYTKHNVVILVGGSGLFINALLNGLDDLPSDENTRLILNQRYESEGLLPLTTQLKELDEESYNAIDTNNPRRVIRALEICLVSGQKASVLKQNTTASRPFIPIKIALNTDRDKLYQRINKRVDAMMDEGLENEVKGLLAYCTLNALQTVGYKELFDYFNGNTSLAKAIDLVKQHTRNYAKRQITWFRKDTEYAWFEPTQLTDIIGHINKVLNTDNAG